MIIQQPSLRPPLRTILPLRCSDSKSRRIVFSLTFMGIFVLSSLLATQICQKWYGLAIGIVMMIIAIPFHCNGKKVPWGYLASFLINSIASGFVVSAYYIKNEMVYQRTQQGFG